MTISGGEFNYIRGLVRDHSALLLEPGKEYLVESRLSSVVQQEGFSSFQGMVESLRSAPFGELHRKVIEAMANNETLFFRDARAFAMLKNTLMPRLLAARSQERSLNVWCAACSSGQEPYSVAMMLRELVPVASWNLRIVGSDLSRDVLDRARAGRYSQLEVNRGLPAHLLVKYFQRERGGWTLRPVIRDMVEFHQINLIEPWPRLPRMDLVLLRNVLIYVGPDTKKSILRRVGRLLAPGGHMLLGAAETTTNADAAFEPVTIDGATCFRVK
jgi:chemotaxis protein methyltransferase CheR